MLELRAVRGAPSHDSAAEPIEDGKTGNINNRSHGSTYLDEKSVLTSGATPFPSWAGFALIPFAATYHRLGPLGSIKVSCRMCFAAVIRRLRRAGCCALR
jgi:hypothetical protein